MSFFFCWPGPISGPLFFSFQDWWEAEVCASSAPHSSYKSIFIFIFLNNHPHNCSCTATKAPEQPCTINMLRFSCAERYFGEVSIKRTNLFDPKKETQGNKQLVLGALSWQKEVLLPRELVFYILSQWNGYRSCLWWIIISVTFFYFRVLSCNSPTCIFPFGLARLSFRLAGRRQCRSPDRHLSSSPTGAIKIYGCEKTKSNIKTRGFVNEQKKIVETKDIAWETRFKLYARSWVEYFACLLRPTSCGCSAMSLRTLRKNVADGFPMTSASTSQAY